jgi:hypothetical protein
VDSYLWAVNNLKKHVWRPQRIPAVFFTNRDLALHGALAKVFLDLQANLCMWHLNKNITTHCKKFFSNKSSDPKKKKANPWNDFMSLWGQVTCAKTPKIYFERFEALKSHLASCPAVL